MGKAIYSLSLTSLFSLLVSDLGSNKGKIDLVF